MNKTILSLFGTALLGTGLMLAQTPAPADNTTAPATPRAGRMARRGPMMMRGMAQLNLTDDQKTQAKAIFQASRQEAQPIAQQLKQARQDLQTAVKNNAAQSQIDTLTTSIGNLSGQLATIRSRSFAKFYAILTPEQQQKLDQRAANFRNVAGQRGWRKAPPQEVQQ